MPTGRIRAASVKEVLAKLVGDSASSCSFLGIQKYLFKGSASLVYGGVPIVVIAGSFERC